MIYLHPKTPHLLKKKRVIVDHHVSDYVRIRRPLKERLFTLPWKPFKSYKYVYCPLAYVTGDGCLVISPQTKKLLDNLK